MAEIHPITTERHGDKRWRKPAGFAFAAGDSVLLLATQELGQASHALPIGLISHDDSYLPVAVLGFRQGQNLFVAPNGEWLGKYLPLRYRAHPFKLARQSENENYMLCVDEAQAGLTTDGNGEAFLDANGKPAPALTEMFNLLLRVEKDRMTSRPIHEQLKRLSLVEPWPLTVRRENGVETAVQGLFRISEAVLKELPAEALVELRDSGALLTIYCQLLSMHNLSVLGALAADRNRQGAALALSVAETPGMLGDNGVISFDNLR